MKRAGLKRITIDPDAAGAAISERYATRAREGGVELALDGGAEVHDGHTLASGKREVFVTHLKGDPVKQCTGLEPHYRCCQLHVMHQTTNCPLDCSYCILQAYINTPVTTVHANVAEMMDDVEARIAQQPRRLFRIGTGDLGDSLALDPLGGATRTLVPRFARLPNAILELKTKSSEVEQLIGLDHGGRTFVSWSLNTPEVITREEHRCASLEERLEAARRVVDDGYRVAFHFDPMVVHPGWEMGYPAVAERILEAIDAERIGWISMGALRFPPAMLKTIEQRFPRSLLTTGELIHAQDGKMRYLKPLRLALFRTLLEALEEAGGRDVFLYLCMEGPEIWRRVFGWTPESSPRVDYAFAASLVRRFPDLMPAAPRWADYRDAPSLARPARPLSDEASPSARAELNRAGGAR